MTVFCCYILIDGVQTAVMGATVTPPESCSLTASPASSLPTRSGRSSAASGRVEKFLLLDAVLSFIQSAVSSRYITWFHVHLLYIVYIHTVEQAGYEL
jgi:hypothetical protein